MSVCDAIRKAFLFACGVAVTASIGCTNEIFWGQYTIVEVRDAATDAPVVGLRMTGNGLLLKRHGAPEDLEIQLEPTDADGQLSIPVNWGSLDEGPPTFTLTVDRGNGAVSLTVRSSVGAEVIGGGVVVRVLDTDGDAPVSEVPSVMVGTSPPSLSIGAYVDVVEVCSNESGEVAWSISTGHVGGPYVDEVTLFAAPPSGFGDTTWTRVADGDDVVLVPRRCSAPLADLQRSGPGYTAIVHVVFADQDVLGETFCMDAADTAIDCP